MTDNVVNDPIDQRDAWNGPEGAAWAEQSKRRIRGGDLVEPLVARSAISAGDRVLDIGCGTGGLTLAVGRIATGGRVLGVDLSTLMISEARAAAAAAGLAHVQFEAADAQTHPFPPASFDLAVSHFGIMFFDDPPAAFANIGAALRVGGRITFACPGPMPACDWYGVPLGALLGDRPTPASAPSAMFSLSDPEVIEGTLGDAGFEDVRVSELPGDFWFGGDPWAAADTLLGTGPVRGFLARTPGMSAARARAVLAEAVAPWQGPDGVRLPGSHWFVEARKPRRRSSTPRSPPRRRAVTARQSPVADRPAMRAAHGGPTEAAVVLGVRGTDHSVVTTNSDARPSTDPRSPATLRARLVHLAVAGTLAAVVYNPAIETASGRQFVRFVVVPVLFLSGVAMWALRARRRAHRNRGDEPSA